MSDLKQHHQLTIGPLNFRYPGSAKDVLNRVSLELHSGELHLLIGENGAGKSTLAKLLSGSLASDDAHCPLPSAQYLPQHLLSRPDTAFWEYLWLYYSRNNRELNSWMTTKSRIDRLLSILNSCPDLSVDQNALREQVSRVSSNLLHLYTALVLLSRNDARYFIFDEPTAVLSESEAEIFYRRCRQVTAQGQSILLITHRINEAFTYAERVTVMRSGLVVKSASISGFSDAEAIASLMFDTTVFSESEEMDKSVSPQRSDQSFSFRHINANFPDLSPLSDISFDAFPGEILALSGIRDEGIEQLERVLSGRSRSCSGSLQQRDTELQLGDIKSLRALPAAFVPSDRKKFGYAPDMTAWENIGIHLRKSINATAPITLGRSWTKRFRELVGKRFSHLDLNLDAAISSYSGGMAQRLIVQRELNQGEGTLSLAILCNPGWGLDPNQREKIYSLIRRKAAEGTAILLLTSEIEEALHLGNSIGFLNAGRLSLPPKQLYGDRHTMELYFLGRGQESAHV